MVANVQTGTVAPTPELVGTVYDVNPVGNIVKGTTITLKVYAPIPAPGTPGALTVSGSEPAANPDGTFLPASQVTLAVPAYQGCPANTSLTAFRVTVNGSPYSGNPLPPSTTSVTITLGATPGDTTVSYLAECSAIQSPSSPTLTLTSKLAASPPAD
jgi:serine/threonine-protein kinase